MSNGDSLIIKLARERKLSVTASETLMPVMSYGSFVPVYCVDYSLRHDLVWPKTKMRAISDSFSTFQGTFADSIDVEHVVIFAESALGKVSGYLRRSDVEAEDLLPEEMFVCRKCQKRFASVVTESGDEVLSTLINYVPEN